MKKILYDSALTGVATLASAMALKQLYKVTGTPKDFVFWFFIGFNAQFAVSIYKKNAMPDPVSAGFGAFGGPIETIDSKIRVYQANISGLQKIVRVGSAKGKIAARKKLVNVERNLAKLFRLRDQAEDAAP